MEAATQLTTKFGGISRAQQAIAMALREGLLKARAEVCVYPGDNDEIVEEKATPKQPIEVSPDVWRWSDNWAADVMRWSWDDGWFEIRGEDAELDRTFIGISFCRADLDQLDPALPALGRIQEERVLAAGAKRGPKTNVQKWGELIGALLQLERENKLRVADYPTIASLRDAVQGKIETDLCLEERTMEGVLSHIWYKHLEGLPGRK
jgi:hypothetical protein